MWPLFLDWLGARQSSRDLMRERSVKLWELAVSLWHRVGESPLDPVTVYQVGRSGDIWVLSTSRHYKLIDLGA